VQVSSHDNLGGASAPITFGIGGNGDGTLGIMGGFMTDFGTHVVNYSTFSGGLDVPTGQVFNISQNLGTAGSGQGTIGKRGDGTLNLSGTNNLTGGQSFFDSGTVSIHRQHHAPVTAPAQPGAEHPHRRRGHPNEPKQQFWRVQQRHQRRGPTRRSSNITGTVS
jgi:hypothetical protein